MTFDKRIRPYHFYIENFRNFKDVSFDLGRKITVLSGQNGVGKSNLLSLIASGSGLNKKSVLGSNFQPEFYDFFNVDKEEDFENYKLYLTYAEENGEVALTKRLAFKNDTKTGRGIRIIPRTSNVNIEDCTIKVAEEKAKMEYDVGGAARVRIPTIYLSLSRLYPLGECKETVKIIEMRKNNSLYLKEADKKYKYWYNAVIPNSIENEAVLTKVEKNACSRASLHMDINNTPTLSQSIGQDNLGNIISALVDIYMLSLDKDYKGALLCIDEIDVSLHPDTQIRLLDLFNKLSKELNIQFVLSTHSLTILKEVLKKEKRNNQDYKIVYLKDPSTPYVTNSKSYELLKADMFGSLSFQQPKVKIYFEDEIGKMLFEMLMKAFENIYHAVKNKYENPILRNSSDVRDYVEINDKIHSLNGLLRLLENTKRIPTILGCEELFKINKADEYFKRIIFVLDGDARYKDPRQKPKIKNYLNKKYDPKESKLNDRSHPDNICFLPDYFAPESFLYSVVYKIFTNNTEHLTFWRGLDSNETTALYTSEKINEIFSVLPSEYNNDDLKKIFTDSFESDIWKFIKESDIVTYYYSDYKTIGELLSFLENIKKAYDIALPLTLSNRYS
ncbi:ATP-dependent nuclease [Anaerostipes amylophilus]|uniref:ATP-dependent nuclease n=1 Tax=Anaerostipes amylophilus TaxID=2981779 RepID=UPI0006C57F63|nr:AAA family ATPase [Anaerostipes amylophilus]MCU6781892.1 AAA family ATPase [Anaerostipes amylophilus]CUO32734.1 recombination protein F [Anaerostipes hadrus]